VSETGRIFLSYSLSESDFAYRLAADLLNAGVNLWMDNLNVAPTDDWAEGIKQALKGTAAMICLASPEYVAAKYCRNELTYGVKKGFTIYPVMVRDVPDAEWPTELDAEVRFDFREWRDARLYEDSFSRLFTAIKQKNSAQIGQTPNSEKRYLNDLISALMSRRSLLEFIELSEDAANTTAARSLRPRSRVEKIWGLSRALEVYQPLHTSATPQAQAEYQQWRKNSVASVQDALSRSKRFVLIGAPGSGKSVMLERLALEAAQARMADPTAAPLPLLLHLASWDDGLNVEDYLRVSWPFEDDPIELLAEGQVSLYLDGLNEMGQGGTDKVALLKAWLAGETAAQQVIIACRSGDYAGAFELGLPVVEIGEMDETDIRRMVTALLGDEQSRLLLAQIFPTRREERETAQPLATLARNPALLANLTFLYKSAPHTELPATAGGIFKRYMAALWVWKRIIQMPGWLPFKEIEAAFGRLAYAMIEQDRPSRIPRTEALEVLGDELLRAGRNAGILEVHEDTVGFSTRLVQEYYAAVGLERSDLQTKLMSPSFDERGDRIASKWDQVIVLLAGIVPNPDDVIREVAEVDPYLVGEAIASGVRVSDYVYDQTIANLTEDAAASAQTGRVAAAKALDQVGRSASVPILLEIMRSASWQARQSASWALKAGGAPVPPALLSTLRDWDWNMDERTAASLRAIGADAVPLLLDVLLEDEQWTRRRGAAWALGEIGDSAAVPGLVAALSDDDTLVRREAALALRAMNDSAPVPALLECLRDDDLRVRKAAAEALSRFKTVAVPGLVAALNDESADVRRISAEVLGRIGDASTKEALIKASRDENVEVRCSAIEALGKLGDHTVIPVLVGYLSDTTKRRYESTRVCDMAAHALEIIGSKEAIAVVEKWRRNLGAPPQAVRFQNTKVPDVGLPAELDEATQQRIQNLVAGLGHSDWQVRQGAVEALGELHGPQVVDALMLALADEDSQVRFTAVRALESHANEQVVEALLAALHDTDYLVSDTAAEVLGRLGGLAMPGLLAALGDENVDVRGRAVEALGKVANDKAVTWLIGCLNDNEKPQWEEKRICELAAEVLEQIGTQEALGAVEAWRERPRERGAFSQVGSRLLGIVKEYFSGGREQSAVPAAADSEEPEPAAPAVTPPPTELPEAPARPAAPMPDPVVEIPKLLERLHSDDWEDQQAAARLLRDNAKLLHGVDDPHTLGLLADALQDSDQFVRWAAVEALAWIREETTVPTLLEALHDHSWSVRLAVLRALLEIGDARVTPVVLECLHDEHALVREMAAEVLGVLSGTAALSGLEAALKDEEGFVRRAAAESLGVIGQVGSVDKLIEALEDDDYHVRWAAAESLGKIGDPAAVMALIDLLDDNNGYYGEDKRLCDVVAESLETIGVPEAQMAVERWRSSRVSSED
jgi:HEAT repeat protein